MCVGGGGEHTPDQLHIHHPHHSLNPPSFPLGWLNSYTVCACLQELGVRLHHEGKPFAPCRPICSVIPRYAVSLCPKESRSPPPPPPGFLPPASIDLAEPHMHLTASTRLIDGCHAAAPRLPLQGSIQQQPHWFPVSSVQHVDGIDVSVRAPFPPPPFGVHMQKHR